MLTERRYVCLKISILHKISVFWWHFWISWESGTNAFWQLKLMSRSIHRHFCFQMICHSRKSVIAKGSYDIKEKDVTGSERVRGRPRFMVWLDRCFVLVRTQQQSTTATKPIPDPSTDPESKCLKAVKKCILWEWQMPCFGNAYNSLHVLAKMSTLQCSLLYTFFMEMYCIWLGKQN